MDDCFEQALRSPEPVSQLRSLALQLLSEGLDQPLVLERFEQARHQLRAEEREADEDAVMDVMDLIAGWCAPSVRVSADPQATATGQDLGTPQPSIPRDSK